MLGFGLVVDDVRALRDLEWLIGDAKSVIKIV